MKKLICHCGAVEIEVNLKDGLTNLKRCNCSMCKRKGAIIKNINKEDLKIIKGEDKLNVYQFKTKVAKHYFCNTCGIHTHNLRRADPNTYGINIACLEGIDPQEIFKLDVGINDGHNHIMDQKK